MDHLPFKIPSLEEEIKLISIYGSNILALSLNKESMKSNEFLNIREEYSSKFKFLLFVLSKMVCQILYQSSINLLMNIKIINKLVDFNIYFINICIYIKIISIFFYIFFMNDNDSLLKQIAIIRN